MDMIVAKYARGKPERYDPFDIVVCPICDTSYKELDIEKYSEEGTKREVECCTSCRENLEADLGKEIDSDVLNKKDFQKLWDMAVDAIRERGESLEDR